MKGFRLDISVEVASAVSITTSRAELESGPTICTVYPMMTPFCFSFGSGVHDSFAVVGRLWLTVNKPGQAEGAEYKTICT